MKVSVDQGLWWKVGCDLIVGVGGAKGSDGSDTRKFGRSMQEGTRIYPKIASCFMVVRS